MAANANRTSVLPTSISIKGTTLPGRARCGKPDNVEGSVNSQVDSHLPHTPNNTVKSDPNPASKKKVKNIRFPVVPIINTSRSSMDELWDKYREIFASDQAGPGIIAHHNNPDHKIVVIKEHKVQTSPAQRRQLDEALRQTSDNVVKLLDVFKDSGCVRPVYEPLDVSLYQIRATNRTTIIEVDLAIIGKEVLQGLQFIHERLGITYGRLNAKNVLLSSRTCVPKLANIAESILDSASIKPADDARSVGILLVDMKEPGTHARNPDSLQLERGDEVSEMCRDFIAATGRLSIKELLGDQFLLKHPGAERLRIFIYRAMEFGAKMRG